jgi:dihydroorotate dehydrogenase (fumarate)
MYTLNISCPNAFWWEPFTTPERLTRLLEQVAQLKLSQPIFIKMPIELSWKNFKDLLDVILWYSIAGVIIGNLKKKREWFIDTQDHAETQHLAGWLSWLATKETCNALIWKTYTYCWDTLIIIWVGGIFSAEDAYTKIKLWSSLVQLITGMIFQWPQLIGEINKWLVQLIKEDGYTHISDAIGSIHRL